MSLMLPHSGHLSTISNPPHFKIAFFPNEKTIIFQTAETKKIPLNYVELLLKKSKKDIINAACQIFKCFCTGFPTIIRKSNIKAFTGLKQH
jgi:hypothetical protein